MSRKTRYDSWLMFFQWWSWQHLWYIFVFRTPHSRDLWFYIYSFINTCNLEILGFHPVPVILSCINELTLIISVSTFWTLVILNIYCYFAKFYFPLLQLIYILSGDTTDTILLIITYINVCMRHKASRNFSSEFIIIVLVHCVQILIFPKIIWLNFFRIKFIT